jgi:DNA-binding NtrC family response regulator
VIHQERGRVGILLLDLTIPGRSSHEVIAEATKAHPDVRIILTSAYSRDMVLAGIGAAWDYDFIRKPFRAEDLLSIISSRPKTKQKAGGL